MHKNPKCSPCGCWGRLWGLVAPSSPLGQRPGRLAATRLLGCCCRLAKTSPCNPIAPIVSKKSVVGSLCGRCAAQAAAVEDRTQWPKHGHPNITTTSSAHCQPIIKIICQTLINNQISGCKPINKHGLSIIIKGATINKKA